MASYEVLNGATSTHLLGSTSLANPVMFLNINGVNNFSSYAVQKIGSSQRFVFPKKVGTEIYLMSMGQVYLQELPQITIAVSVFLAE